MQHFIDEPQTPYLGDGKAIEESRHQTYWGVGKDITPGHPQREDTRYNETGSGILKARGKEDYDERRYNPVCQTLSFMKS